MVFFNFNDTCSGNCGCFMLQIKMQITYWMAPYMPDGRIMQKIVVVVVLQKSAQFSNGDYCVQTSYICYKQVSTEY